MLCTAVKLSNTPAGTVVMPLSCRSNAVVLAQQPAQVSTPPVMSQQEAAELHAGDGDGVDCAATLENSAESKSTTSACRCAKSSAIRCNEWRVRAQGRQMRLRFALRVLRWRSSLRARFGAGGVCVGGHAPELKRELLACHKSARLSSPRHPRS